MVGGRKQFGTEIALEFQKIQKFRWTELKLEFMTRGGGWKML